MRRRRPQLFSPEPVDAILARAGEDRFAPERAPISGPLWRTIVGPRVADRALPVKLDSGVLVIRAATSAWAQELSLLSETLIERLRAHGIEVAKLSFRTGPIDPPARPPERRKSTKVPRPAPLPAAIEGTLAQVDDDELRSAIAGAIAQSLATAAYVLAISESPPAARDPRSVERESAPPDRGSASDPAGSRRSPAGERGRSQ